MRKHLSLAFVWIASGLIVLQLGASLFKLANEQTQKQVLHSVSLQTDNSPATHKATPAIDFQRLAEEMAQEKY